MALRWPGRAQRFRTGQSSIRYAPRTATLRTGSGTGGRRLLLERADQIRHHGVSGGRDADLAPEPSNRTVDRVHLGATAVLNVLEHRIAVARRHLGYAPGVLDRI